MPTAEALPNTRVNPGVKAFRHAMSIDEARYMFRLDVWQEDQEFKPNPFSQGEPSKQDAKQVWFPGYHGDVGGGHPRGQSGQSQYPLCWMIDEASKCGLHFNTRTVNTVALGDPYNDRSTYLYPKPSTEAPLHSSKRTPWAALEWMPKLTRYREDESRGSFAGLYLSLIHI